MAGISLVQSAKMTNDVLQAGVIEILVSESKLLHLLPFMDIQGSGYTYNVEIDRGSAQFRKVNGGYTNRPIGTQLMTEALVILGDEAIVDTFQIAVHSDVNNLMAIEVALRTKEIGHKFEKCFMTGAGAGVPSETEANEFYGILTRYITNNRTPDVNTVQHYMKQQTFEATSSIVDDIDLLLDMVNNVDCLIMNKKTRRGLTAAARTSCEYKQSEFGVQFLEYGGVKIVDVESDILADDYILAVKFGAKEGVCGLQNGGIRVTALGEMESQPQLKTRIEWFVGLAVFNPLTVAIRMPKVDATAVAADVASKTIAVGESFQVKATLTPADATTPVVFTTSNAAKVTVDKFGVVTGVAATGGTAVTITAKAGSATATVSVTVTA